MNFSEFKIKGFSKFEKDMFKHLLDTASLISALHFIEIVFNGYLRNDKESSLDHQCKASLLVIIQEIIMDVKNT